MVPFGPEVDVKIPGLAAMYLAIQLGVDTYVPEEYSNLAGCQSKNHNILYVGL